MQMGSGMHVTTILRMLKLTKVLTIRANLVLHNSVCFPSRISIPGALIMKQCCMYLIAILLFWWGTPVLFSSDLHADVQTADSNIVLITIDTLRADHLSCYGYERITTPHIDGIAAQGIIFKNVVAPSSWTAPSMASLFTSTYPINHGVVHGIKFRKEKKEILSDELVTLPEILQKKGYTTFGVSSNHHLTEELGFARGFDYFEYQGWKNAELVNRIVCSWEDTLRQSEKYFLWIHYNDPHIPYVGRSPWIESYAAQSPDQALRASRKSKSHLRLNEFIPTLKEDPQSLSDLVALYDSEISYVDFHIGELMKKLELDKDTLIIITSDHGEEFLDHGQLGHGKNLHRETVNIPLIIKQPYSSNKETVESYVKLIDIMPTILDLINVNFPEQTLGKSVWERNGFLLWLRKIVSGKDTSDFSFIELDRQFSMKSIMTPQWKYIYNYEDETEQLYNIAADLLEVDNLVDKEEKQRDWLKEQLFHWVSSAKKYPPRKRSFTLSPEEEEKLRELGYIQGE